jgi:TolB-like protein/DNA-binding winged helix-turn-helix (wHTH) protein/Flp pilus assembly protein TadD
MAIRIPGTHVVRFGVFELDRNSGELRRNGLKIRLPDQSFHILDTLLIRSGEVVGREELRQVLWTSDTFVDFETGLNSAVRKLREALDDSADNPRFIETLPRRGYRFIAPVSAPAVELVASPEPPPAPESIDVTAQAVPPAAGRRALSALYTWRAAGVVLVLLGVAWGTSSRRAGLLTTPAVVSADPIRAIVVLPFENLSGDPAQDYFAETVTDAITVHLAQLADLDVISRTSARYYKQTAKRLPEIGQELSVDGVVTGTVARSASGVSLRVTLISAATDHHLWARTYEGDLSHIIAVQQRIALDISVATGRSPAATVASRASQSVNPAAYDRYIKGLTAHGEQRQDGLRRAVGYFEEAIAIQPDFAEAYAALALSQVQFLYGGPFSPHQAVPKAEAAARKALQLDDTLPRAHWALGQILNLYYWRWDDGDKALQRVTELYGGRSAAVEAVSISLIRRGRFAEAVATAERGRRLDPLSPNAQVAVGIAYRASGQHDRALDEFRRALEMSPGNNRVRFQIGVTFVAMGRLEEAIRELERAARPARGHNSRVEAYLGYAYAAAGRSADARKVLNELESHRIEQYVSSFGIALIHDALGDKKRALAALHRAHEDRAVEFGQMAQYPPFRTIAAEPAFQRVMQDVGLPR